MLKNKKKKNIQFSTSIINYLFFLYTEFVVEKKKFIIKIRLL